MGSQIVAILDYATQYFHYISLFFLNSTLTVTVYAEIIAGYVNIVTNGGNGKPGQNGANGRKAADSMHKVHYSIIDVRNIGKLREKSLFIACREWGGGGEGRVDDFGNEEG